MTNFSSEKIEARRQWNSVFKELKGTKRTVIP
jgi:hypothetical protein